MGPQHRRAAVCIGAYTRACVPICLVYVRLRECMRVQESAVFVISGHPIDLAHPEHNTGPDAQPRNPPLVAPSPPRLHHGPPRAHRRRRKLETDDLPAPDWRQRRIVATAAADCRSENQWQKRRRRRVGSRTIPGRAGDGALAGAHDSAADDRRSRRRPWWARPRR